MTIDPRPADPGWAPRGQAPRPLDRDFSAQFGHWDREPWHALMGAFGDANLYQTWSYDRVRYDRRHVVHMVLRKREAVVAAAQARVIRLPRMRAGIAYVRWGPMWRPAGAPEDPAVFRQAVRALRSEFAHRQGLVLRLYPLAYRDRDRSVGEILHDEGYLFHETGSNERTLLIDLDVSLEQLRAALDPKWRNKLKQAERNGLEVIVGADEALFDDIATMYGEMASRKGLDVSSDIDHLKAVQRDLPAALKLWTVLCRLNGHRCAGAIFSTIGTTAVYLRGATSDAGLKTNASYAVQWAFVRWLKEHGLVHYDLNGINPDANPGTYFFKRGLAGKRGRDVEFVGRFQMAGSPLGAWIVKTGERLAPGYQRAIAAASFLRRG
jgi:hypothetical protein